MSEEARCSCHLSLMGVGKALAYAGNDVVHSGHPLVLGAPTRALDPQWIPSIAAAGVAAISRDRHIRTRTAELEALQQAGLRMFWIADKRDLSSWVT